MDESREGKALVREFRRFQEVRLKFYGRTLDNIELEIFLKFSIYQEDIRNETRGMFISLSVLVSNENTRCHFLGVSRELGGRSNLFWSNDPDWDLGLTWSYTPVRAGADRNYNRLKEENYSSPFRSFSSSDSTVKPL